MQNKNFNAIPQGFRLSHQILPQEGRFELNSKVCLVVPSDAPEVKALPTAWPDN